MLYLQGEAVASSHSVWSTAASQALSRYQHQPLHPTRDPEQSQEEEEGGEVCVCVCVGVGGWVGAHARVRSRWHYILYTCMYVRTYIYSLDTVYLHSHTIVPCISHLRTRVYTCTRHLLPPFYVVSKLWQKIRDLAATILMHFAYKHTFTIKYWYM